MFSCLDLVFDSGTNEKIIGFVLDTEIDEEIVIKGILNYSDKIIQSITESTEKINSVYFCRIIHFYENNKITFIYDAITTIVNIIFENESVAISYS